MRGWEQFCLSDSTD